MRTFSDKYFFEIDFVGVENGHDEVNIQISAT